MAATYDPLYTASLSGVASYTFSTISSAYTDLIIVINGSTGGASSNPYIQLNGTSTSNYYRMQCEGTGGNTTPYKPSGGANQGNGDLSNNMYLYEWSTIVAHIMDYNSTHNWKTIMTRWGNSYSGNAGQSLVVNTLAATGAVTSIKVGVNTSSFISGSNVTIYGIAAA